ncbi:uncharacterized protein BP5553_00528 [Venustampulla echinocandica]|uniref:Alpha/beta hydrolase fold-3 domain-containing protein n=1 Tax=Venustampulla echinocandica TaxID=2656787 RepID=A0A370TYE7_9HELO|nr:uncharacterized protein BP5553_00528 [Venustampulla echinocandica]RDL40549.1 hypothetical protein BP5553_00528 [Venustampulla echinocandica]
MPNPIRLVTPDNTKPMHADPALNNLFWAKAIRKCADHLLELGPFGELVMNNRLYILRGLVVVKQSLQFVVVDAPEVLLSIHLLKVLVAFFGPIADLPHERPVYLAHLRLFSLIQKSIPASDLHEQSPSFPFLLDDLRIRRERVLKVYRHLLGSVRVASNTHVGKGAKTLNVIVFSLGYRLAPENPFPIPFDDANDGLKWAYANASKYGGDVKKGFVCGGTSFGGHLAALATYRAQKLGILVSGCFSRAPMVLDRSVAKEAWKETLDILPKDVYTPLLNLKTCERFYEYMAIPPKELTSPANDSGTEVHHRCNDWVKMVVPTLKDSSRV